MLRRMVLVVGLVVMLVPAAGVLAGGWVVITLETLPEQIQAGEPLELSFMVRQHGWVPTHDISPVLTAANKETGRQIQAEAQPASKVGQFTVEVKFPEAGAWDWSISAEPFMQTTAFAPLTVLGAEAVAGPEQSAQRGVGQQATPVQIDKASAVKQAVGLDQIDPAGASVQVFLRVAGLALLAAVGILMVVGRRPGRSAAAATSGD